MYWVLIGILQNNVSGFFQEDSEISGEMVLRYFYNKSEVKMYWLLLADDWKHKK